MPSGGRALLGFSANTQPDAFWLRVYGEKMQAVANLFETRLTIDRAGGGPKPLRPLFNGLREARDVPPRRPGRPEAQAQRRSRRI